MSLAGIPVMDQAVYVRRVRSTPPPTAASAEGFAYEPRLRCRSVDMVSGPQVGQAVVDYVPLDGQLPTFGDVLGEIRSGDQILVSVGPVDHPLLAVPETMVFLGAVVRTDFGAAANGVQEDEGVSFICWPLAIFDDQGADHVVSGRWTAINPREAGSSVKVIESPDLPAAPNFDGRPNCASAARLTTQLGEVRVFTHDDDADGTYWTAREFLWSLLGHWLYGVDEELPRSVAIEDQTLAALRDGGSGDRWAGLDEQLPEVSVHGLGVLQAVDRVCRAIGYEMHVMLSYDPAADRPYLLSLNRLGHGPDVTVKLQQRGQVGAEPLTVLRRNHVSVIEGTRDASGLRNEVQLVGRAYVEASLVCKPLWDPAAALAHDDDRYAARHVQGGAEYAEYGHVGRLWGVACTGREPGYSSGVYAHPAAGFDFVSELGLAADGSAVVSHRQAQGLPGGIDWTRRVRPMLPLRRPDAAVLGDDYVIEVSENGGGQWTAVPTLTARTQRGLCGIRLTGIEDLAAVNLATIGSDGPSEIDPADSWWAMIASGDLLLRVTCLIPADHAAGAIATRRPGTSSLYPTRVVERTRSEEVWAAPQSYFNDSSTWVRVRGYGVGDGSADPAPVQEQASRRRDALESERVRAGLGTWLMDFTRWRLGDRVTRIEGRNFDLRSSTGTTGAYPSVTGIRLQLAGRGEQAAAGQSLRIDLTDASILGGS